MSQASATLLLQLLGCFGAAVASALSLSRVSTNIATCHQTQLEVFETDSPAVCVWKIPLSQVPEWLRKRVAEQNAGYPVCYFQLQISGFKF